MQQVNRWKDITTLLQKEGFLSVEQLAEDLQVSEATIRRDLVYLDENDVIIRTRGGAKPKTIETVEPEFKSKLFQNSDAKNEIAKYAASLIRDGDYICMDSGSTTFAMIQFINAKEITAVTNGICHAQALIEKGIRTCILPGLIKEVTCAAVGTKTLEQINQFNFDKAFVGANGVSVMAGFTTHEMNEGDVKQQILDRAKEKYVLVDSTKINREYFVSFYPLKNAIMITETRKNFDYNTANCIIVDEQENTNGQ